MHHEAALWACASYDEVSTIWANMDAARIERGWKPASIDAYNAVIWRLYLDDRPDDIHLVLNEVKRVGLTPNDRTLHGVQRMGERIAQRKRAERDSWYVRIPMTLSPSIPVVQQAPLSQPATVYRLLLWYEQLFTHCMPAVVGKRGRQRLQHRQHLDFAWECRPVESINRLLILQCNISSPFPCRDS